MTPASGSSATRRSRDRWCRCATIGPDRRVTTVMIEVRRGLYCDEATGEPLAAFAAMRDRIRDAAMMGLLAADATRA